MHTILFFYENEDLDVENSNESDKDDFEKYSDNSNKSDTNDGENYLFLEDYFT